jgi:hypothetical protein
MEIPGYAAGSRQCVMDNKFLIFIYLLTNAYKQLHSTRQRKKTEHALGVTKGGKPPPTRHSREYLLLSGNNRLQYILID